MLREQTLSSQKVTSFLNSIGRNSEKSRQTYATCLAYFQTFLSNSETYRSFTIESIIGKCLLFIGLYSTAVSVSYDLTMRKQIRTYANELVLLDKMGTPEMKQQVETLVSRIMKDLKNKAHYLAESSGISPSIDEENFNEYLQMVIKEIKKGK